MAAAASERVEFRITPDLKDDIEAASAMLGLTTSAFVKDAALRLARETIHQERQIQLGAEAWEKFTAAVDRPGEYVEGFAELLRRPSVFSND
ncbi:uncharacterized protein (DUF1778 family) [Homoserinimonas aerilata]|uniref:Uncharacterized protein (DUF1778 family) n=1 Tax=Homoserinimonas aerilata TaxID=1162970 RepID=A0A542YG98_9MICO|nr:DUF1778 domain-containing protein [Homoserinimonas aerilata]TQL47122.1 uncharacterized protein (DUF1778 family) [Homoserinimonas aerilata]